MLEEFLVIYHTKAQSHIEPPVRGTKMLLESIAYLSCTAKCERIRVLNFKQLIIGIPLVIGRN